MCICDNVHVHVTTGCIYLVIFFNAIACYNVLYILTTIPIGTLYRRTILQEHQLDLNLRVNRSVIPPGHHLLLIIGHPVSHVTNNRKSHRMLLIIEHPCN